MPTSHFYQMNEIAELIFIKQPKSVLDIGIGFGKYGVLTREYLDVWNERYSPNQWQVKLDGIEAFKEYVSPLHNYIYNHIYIGNALSVLPALNHKYDLIIMIDVLEHFEKEEGVKILKLCQQHAKGVIVSTPKKFLEQQDNFGNAFEIHRSHWTEYDIDKIAEHKLFLRNKISLLCYIGEDAAFIKQELSKRRNVLEKAFAFLLMLWERLSIKKR